MIGQFIKRFYPNVNHLDYDIEQSLNGESYTTLPSHWPAKNRKYELGTVAQVKVSEHTVYLVAIADKNEHGNVSEDTSFKDVELSLAMVWEYIRNRGDGGEIVIALMGTGLARIMNRTTSFREIVKSFVAANADKKLCDKLTIVVHPADYRKYELHLGEMLEFLRSVCTVTEFSTRVYGGRQAAKGKSLEEADASSAMTQGQ